MGKTPEAHDIALALADADFDLVLLQEPWSKWDDGRVRLKLIQPIKYLPL